MDKLRINQLKSLFDEIGHYINIDDHFREVTKMVVFEDRKRHKEITETMNTTLTNVFYSQ